MQFIPTSLLLDFELISTDDLKVLYSLIDGHIREFLMEDQEFSESECLAFLENGEKILKATGLGFYLAYHQNNPIGYCGFMNTRPLSDGSCPT